MHHEIIKILARTGRPDLADVYALRQGLRVYSARAPRPGDRVKLRDQDRRGVVVEVNAGSIGVRWRGGVGVESVDPRFLMVAATIDPNDIVGNTYWGREAKVHVFDSSVNMEEIPQGKRRGITANTMTWYVPAGMRSVDVDALIRFLGAVKTGSYKKLAGMLIKLHGDHKKTGARSELNIRRQKGVHAPEPGAADLPRPSRNAHKVYIDMTGDAVSLRDDNDQNNLPSAFTQGPRAYKLALKIRDTWEGLRFREILDVWKKNKIKFHYYMAMD